MPRPVRGRRYRNNNPIRQHTVGHDVMDSDHDVIARCCRQITNSTAAEIEIQLHRLRSILESHFKNEENLLRAAGSDLCACHARDHQLMLALCDQAIAASKERVHSSRRVILRDLIPALRNHIASHDQVVALYLNTREEDVRGLLH